MKFRRKDWMASPIGHAIAAEFICQHHYAGSTANTSVVRAGLYRAGNLWNADIMGAALWMPAPFFAVKKSGYGPREVLTLSRLAIHPTVPTNGASFLIGWSIRHIKKHLPHIRLLITYADEAQGHTGAIYRATNWGYEGPTLPYLSWYSEGGLVSAYCDGKKRTVRQMKALGYIRKGPFRKHKFTMKL